MRDIDECTVGVDCAPSGELINLPSENELNSLRDCIKQVRLWIAEAMAVNNTWRSIMSGTSRFNQVVMEKKRWLNLTTEVNVYVHEHLVSLYRDILTMIPSIYGNISGKSKLAILKVIADAIDTSIDETVKDWVSICAFFAEAGTMEDYLRGWSLENYRALKEAMIQSTDTDISINDYESTVTYKNPWER